MHEWGDSGISAILLAVIVILALSLGLVRQARAKTVRYQRIRRLVTEEARRDEAEALAEYRSMVANCNICTVCSNPSATRCSRCKAVRYCSSACQRLHWKQGHKLECRPATSVITPVTSGISPVTSSSGNGSSGSSTRAISDVSESYAQVELAKPASGTTENGTLGRPKEILYPYEDFVELFYKERLQVPPCGLINCGNSCFANVVLQCLTFTRPLTAYLLEGTHGEQCRRSSDWCFMCELQDHVWRVRVSPNPLSPIRILARIRNIGNHLGYGRQEDAHEFMRFAIDSMQSICVDEAGGEKSVDPRSQETTIVHHIFGGYLQSQVICMQCLQESNRYESMMDLAVEIQGSVETLEDALLQFTAHECLDGDNKYKCDRCNAYVKATKRLTMHEAPNILTIALKRFQGGKFGKLNKRVTFPEILDVAPYMSGKGDNPPLYRLYAVVVHVDMLNASFFGHYICYVKDSEGLWYKLDDSKVKEVDLEKVMSQRAYMLLYTRGFARPPPLTDELNSSYPVEAAHKLASDISVRQGSSKVYPAPPYLREEIISERSQGLHAMVDFNQLQAELQGNSQTVWEHSLANGEIASPQLSGWEAERNASGSTSLDDEASTEDSGYEATSLTQTSSCISTRANNSRIVVSPPQDCVCQELDTFVEDGMDYVREDTQEQCQPSEVSEISLQPFAGDTSHNSKIAKRRLEDGLSPLPTPKPLNTDQLPAWPPGNPGLSVTGPQVHTSAISACHPLSEGSPSLQKHDVENTGESMPLASLSRQRMMASDHSLAEEGTSHEADGSDLVMLEISDEGEESSLVRAKRQHVEIETGADASTEAPRLEELSHPKEESSPELVQRDVDWDRSSLHSGSPPSLSNFEVVRPSEKGVLVDIGQYSSQREDISELQLPHFVQWEPKGNLSAGREAIQVDVEEGNMYNKRDMPVQPASIIPPEGAYIRPGKESSVPENQQESILKAAAATTAGVDSPMSTDEVDLSLDSPAIGGLSKISGPLSNCEAQGVPNRSLRGRASKSKSKPLFAPGFLNRTQAPAAKAKAKGFREMSTTTAAVEDKNLNQVEASGKILPESGPPFSLIQGQGDISPIDRENSEEVTSPPGMDQCCSSTGVSQPKEGEMCDPSSTSDVQQASTEIHQQLCDKYTGDSSGASHLTPPILSTHAPVQDEAPENQATNFSVNGGQERLSSKSTSATGNGKEKATQPAPPVNLNEERQPMVIDRAVPCLSKPSIGKQKQGRNETCKCGSQRKWKKCCGKAVVIKPEQGRRRLVV